MTLRKRGCFSRFKWILITGLTAAAAQTVVFAQDATPSPENASSTEVSSESSETKDGDSKSKKEKGKDKDEEAAAKEKQPPSAASIFAQQGPDDRGFHATLGGMFLTNSADQGGSGPGGSTLLTQLEACYHWRWIGGGMMGQLDMQGSSEVDFNFGPKIEGRFMIFYAEVAFMPYLRRGFSDRSIASQVGMGWSFGLGVRVPVKLAFLKKTPFNGSFFLQASYKYRIATISYQDSTRLSEVLVQRDGYPLFGLGYQF